MITRKIGIDAGGTLIKIAYEENNRFHFRKYPLREQNEAINWLKLLAPSGTFALTGGRSGMLKSTFFPESSIVPEFDAACDGAVYFIKEAGISIDKFLLVNIGTGTSFYLIDKGNHQRLLGSGVGGGTLIGLGKLLTKEGDFHNLVELSGKGDKGQVDLLVKDIYAPHEPPIEGSLTASNFAKAGTDAISTYADQMASVNNMIAETLILLSMQSASIHQVKDIVFIGTTLAGNKPLEQSLRYYSGMLGINPIFLKNGEYSGALGALFSI